jgi:hypothetical protein
MKRLVHFIAAAAFLALTGCLLPETIENRVRFVDKNTPPQITVIWHNISSDAKNDDELKKDFDNFIQDQIEDQDDSLQSDLFVGAREKDMLIKERKMYVEKGKLEFRVSAIPADNDIEDLASGGERLLVLDMEEAGLIEETNGRLFKTDENYIIVWPETMKELYWTQRIISDKLKDKKDRDEVERWKHNRPKIVKMFEAYQQKGSE